MDLATSSAYQSIGLLDTDYDQVQNYKLHKIDDNQLLAYKCVNQLFGLFKDEQILYYIRESKESTSMSVSDLVYYLLINFPNLELVSSNKLNLGY